VYGADRDGATAVAQRDVAAEECFTSPYSAPHAGMIVGVSSLDAIRFFRRKKKVEDERERKSLQTFISISFHKLTTTTTHD
jgi:hypothetical protein